MYSVQAYLLFSFPTCKLGIIIPLPCAAAEEKWFFYLYLLFTLGIIRQYNGDFGCLGSESDGFHTSSTNIELVVFTPMPE